MSAFAEQETSIPSGPEPSGQNESPCSPDCVTSGTAALTADNPERRSDEAADRVSAPEMGNRKSSARNSGSARRGKTASQLNLPMGDAKELRARDLRVKFTILAGIAIAQHRAGHFETAKQFQELVRKCKRMARAEGISLRRRAA